MRTPIFEGLNSTHGFKHRGEMFFDKNEGQIYICSPAPTPPAPPTPVFPTRERDLSYFYDHACNVFFIGLEGADFSGNITQWEMIECDASIVSGGEYVTLHSGYATLSNSGIASIVKTWYATYRTGNGRIKGTSNETYTIRFTQNGEFLRDVTLPVSAAVHTEYTLLNLSSLRSGASQIVYTPTDALMATGDNGFTSSFYLRTSERSPFSQFTGMTSEEIHISDATWASLVTNNKFEIPTYGVYSKEGVFRDLASKDISAWVGRLYVDDGEGHHDIRTVTMTISDNKIQLPVNLTPEEFVHRVDLTCASVNYAVPITDYEGQAFALSTLIIYINYD